MREETNFARRLLAWYARHQRRLPWRLAPDALASDRLDPYHVLVSEAMLQQTQVATVIPYYDRFIARFPSVIALANAPLVDVLLAWQGLGYYSRARNLQKSAVAIVQFFGGKIPRTVPELLTLPGVGRYTAGAVASLAFGTRAPILDGNVLRVLCRLDAIIADPRQSIIQSLLWDRATAILPADRVGDFNSALMELGATVCTPRSPRCLLCPVRSNCQAADMNLQESIPPKKPALKTALHKRWVLCVRHEGQFLLEQRPPTGRWAGLWQFQTVEHSRQGVSQFCLSRFSQLQKPRRLGRVTHALSHRRYQFDAYLIAVKSTVECTPSQQWVSTAAMNALPMSVPQLKVRRLVEADAAAQIHEKPRSPRALAKLTHASHRAD